MILTLGLHQLLARDSGPLSSDPIPASSSNDRNLSGIVWSCLTTIFACTWIAIHPNIPHPSERPISRRLRIFALALITPELIVLWALRQWMSSRKLARKYKEFGWTQTHGYFATMGGFQVCRPGGSTPFPLKSQYLRPYLENRDIDISEKDIQDKSKGDVLSKGLVLIQVTWFVLQVFARAIQHLAITELEVVTLAFAALNFMTYFFWWNKPLDVNCPIRVATYYPSDDRHSSFPEVTPAFEEAHRSNIPSPSVDDDDYPTSDTPMNPSHDPESFTIAGMTHDKCADIYRLRQNLKLDDKSHPHQSTASDLPLPEKAILVDRTNYDSRNCCVIETLRMQHREPCSAHRRVCRRGAKILHRLWSISFNSLITMAEFFYAGINLILMEFVTLAAPHLSPSGEYSFGPLSQAEFNLADIFASGVAIMFGAVHCVAWNFTFPTKLEATLWRVSSMIITCTPIFSLTPPRLIKILQKEVTLLNMLFVNVVSILYGLARLLLLVEMFVLLRKPDTGIYKSVDWVTYIPHI